ncbi:MAG TPA: hypothetical protein VGC30_14010, partial [Dokdonella sp.]
GGRATLSGSVVVAFDGGTPVDGSRYRIVGATSIDGAFAGVKLPDGVSGRLVDDADGVWLEIGSEGADRIFADGFDDAPPAGAGATPR